jgi:hypothetical protein
MDAENPVIRLCVAVTRSEFAGNLQEARNLAWLAWQARTDDYEACIAAHYVARYQESKHEVLRWNQRALEHARAANDGSCEAFYPSLYLNLGRAYENLGDEVAAQLYYTLAERCGAAHQGEQKRIP